MIYALVDKETLDARKISLFSLLQHLNNFQNIPILQYRNKSGSLEEKKTDLLMIREYYSGIVIINDTIDLIAYADGLHIGQEDIREYSTNLKEAVLCIRQKIGSKILGLSTHNQKEIEEANMLDLDYIGLGAFRSTNTKPNVDIGGESLLEFAKYSKHSVGIIGGVKIDDKFEAPIIYKVIGSGLLTFR